MAQALKAAIAAAGLVCTVSLPAKAGEVSSAGFSLVAEVQSFCRLQPLDSNTTPLTQGYAELGSFKEVCNSPNGHVITARFENVQSGYLTSGGRQWAINNGVATITEDGPRARTQAWALVNAVAINVAAPVFLQVAVTPR